MLLPYVVAQVVGAVVGAAGFSLAGGFASNGDADHSPGGYSMGRP